MGSGHLAPDDSHLRLGLAVGDTGLVLGLVHVGAPLANVPPGLILLAAAVDLEESGVFVLVPLASLVPGEHRLGVQPSTWRRAVCSCWFLWPLLYPVNTALEYRRPDTILIRLYVSSLVEVNQAIL